MQFFWLNDALTIKSENTEERHALAVLLKAVQGQRPMQDHTEGTSGDDQESTFDSGTLEHGINYVVIR